MVHSMMSMSKLPVSFWGYALEIAVYLFNRVPTKSVPNTPYEFWTGKKPSLNHIKIWGCPSHVTKPNVDFENIRKRSFENKTKSGYQT